MADPLTAAQTRQLAELVAVYPIADELGRRFERAGEQLYLVGGTVRDTLLGRPVTDLDFAVSTPPARTQSLLRAWADGIWTPGERYGTVSARKSGYTLELTTFRSDVYTARSRHPEVTFAGDIEADLSRRDFTINAMAVRLPGRRFIDPHGGLTDLRDRVLRTPLDPETSFGDDPLRMVRLARFAATLDAQPDDQARKAATAMASSLDDISRERIRDELNKLVCADGVERGMDLLIDTGLADRFLPEIPALRMQRDPLHHHKDVYVHTMAVVRGCPADDLVLRLAALLHDIGKPATRGFLPDGRVTFHHHEVVGARMATARMRDLRYPGDVIEAVSSLVALHLRFHGYGDEVWTDAAVRRYVRDAGSDEQLRRLNLLTRADVTTRNKAKAQRLRQAMDHLQNRIERLAEQEELASIRPPLDGRQVMAHLGLQPGPQVGAALRMLLEVRMEEGPIPEERAYQILDEWVDRGGLDQDEPLQ